MKGKKILVIGDGGWGTALAILLHKRGHRVTLWSAFPDYARILRQKRKNTKFLPGIPIPRGVIITADAGKAKEAIDFVVVAVPSRYLRSVLERFEGYIRPETCVVSVTKGIERMTLLRPSELIRKALGSRAIVVLSGPSHAEEVARNLPATVVAACEDMRYSREVQANLSTERFRIYTSSDVVGVELGGALKNIIAIAAGISDGLALGDNAKAALMTRGLAEITRLGLAMGARAETFSGLSGLGDLITTCASPYGRNRAVGLAIGKGEKLRDILQAMEMVAEGVETTKAARSLARRLGVQMPITEEVYRILFRGKRALEAVNCLMTRALRPEAH